MSKARVMNPVTNTEEFGRVPPLTLQSKHHGVIVTLDAPIYLSEGKHIGPNSGFGVVHIWAEHEAEILADGYKAQTDVPAYVQKMLTQPAIIYFEDREVKNARVNAVRIKTGTVILEYVRTIINKVETPHWRVITAYSNTRTQGVLVGMM